MTVLKILQQLQLKGNGILTRFLLISKISRKKTPNASTLSGGEQQMLVIGRGLMTNPNLLILDEATEGLSPTIRSEIWKVIKILKVKVFQF